MKKILLSCVTCLLALGLVTACEDEVEDVTPEDPNAGVVAPGDDDGGSTEPGGSGDEEDFLPVLGTVKTGEYFLGIEVDSVPYYFNGEVLQSYYGDVSVNGYDAVVVTVAEVTGGYTLSFTEGEATQYIQMAESDTHRNFVWGDDPYVWSYDTTFETFVALDSEGVYYYMGTYGTYKEMTLSQYSYLEEGASSYAQYPAHLYDVITYVAPTAIIVTVEGEASVEVGRRISLTATASGDGNVDPRVTWTSSDEEKATVSDSGSVLGVAEGEVTITATSVLDSTKKGELTITVTEATTPLVTYKLGSCDERNLTYHWFTGSTTGSTYLASSTSWSDAVDVYIEAIDDDEIDNSCTLSFYNSSSELKYISWSSGTNITLEDSAFTWAWDETNELFYAPSSGEGTNVRFITQFVNGSFRAYQETEENLTYPHVTAYSAEPEALTAKTETPTLNAVTEITAGTYYFGFVDDSVTHLIDGRVISNYLTAATDFSYAVEVTVAQGTSDTSKWTLQLEDESYIYATGSTYNLGIGVATGKNNVKEFSWNATMGAFTYTASNNNNYYLEFYNSYITAYSYTSETAVTNAALLYSVVEG